MKPPSFDSFSRTAVLKSRFNLDDWQSERVDLNPIWRQAIPRLRGCLSRESRLTPSQRLHGPPMLRVHMSFGPTGRRSAWFLADGHSSGRCTSNCPAAVRPLFPPWISRTPSIQPRHCARHRPSRRMAPVLCGHFLPTIPHRLIPSRTPLVWRLFH
jgi:hypothetical protein